MNASLFMRRCALAIFAVFGVGSCRGAHGETTCREGCAGDEYCSVTADRDPDGGCQYSASCEPLPATCAEAPTCACLIDQELAPYREQGWADDEVFVDCDGDAAGGFSIDSS